jgi:hypothetical protein
MQGSVPGYGAAHKLLNQRRPYTKLKHPVFPKHSSEDEQTQPRFFQRSVFLKHCQMNPLQNPYPILQRGNTRLIDDNRFHIPFESPIENLFLSSIL